MVQTEKAPVQQSSWRSRRTFLGRKFGAIRNVLGQDCRNLRQKEETANAAAYRFKTEMSCCRGPGKIPLRQHLASPEVEQESALAGGMVARAGQDPLYELGVL